MRRSLSPLVLLLLACGCYRYQPGSPTDWAVGSEVRLKLNAAGAQSLAAEVGQGVDALSGRLIEIGDSQVAVSMGRTYRPSGSEVAWSGERVVVPRAAILGTERRVLDRKRTTLASVAAVLGAGLVGAILKSVSTKGSPGGGTTPPPPL